MRRLFGLAMLSAIIAAEPASSQRLPGPAPSKYVLLNAVLGEEVFGSEVRFPPEGVLIESLQIGCLGGLAMVTLRVPPARLDEVHMFLQQFAWKGRITTF